MPGEEDAGAAGAVPVPSPSPALEAHPQKRSWKTPSPHFCQPNLLQQLFAAGLMVPVSTYRRGVMVAGNVSASGSRGVEISKDALSHRLKSRGY